MHIISCAAAVFADLSFKLLPFLVSIAFLCFYHCLLFIFIEGSCFFVCWYFNT